MKPLDAREARPLEGGRSFSRSNQIFRAIWQLSWLVLAAWTPPPLHGWRRTVLRLFGARIGKGARVYASARIWHPGNLQMDALACMGPGVRCYNQGRITIGERTVVSQYAYLCASSHEVDDFHFQLTLRPIQIGANAWIAADAFVGPGVVVGDGAVLGARGAAFRNLDAWSIYRGNPAQLVRERRHAEWLAPVED